MNASGMTVAAWTESAVYTPQDPSLVLAAVRAPGGNWSEPVVVSDPHVQAGSPRVAMNDHGDAFVGWSIRETYPDGRLYDNTFTTASRWRMADGRWTESDVLEASRNRYGMGHLTATPAGDVLSQEARGAPTFALAHPGGPLGPIATVSGLSSGGSVAFAPDGTTLLAGLAPGATPERFAPRLLMVAPDGSTRTVDVPVPSDPPAGASDVKVGAASAGGAILSWVQQQGFNRRYAWYALVSTAGTITAQGQLPGKPADIPIIAAQSALPEGRTGFVVSDGTSASSQIALIERLADGSFETHVFDPDGNGSLLIDAAMQSDGTALATWEGAGFAAMLGIRAPDGTVTRRALSAGLTLGNPVVALRGQAYAVLWAESPWVAGGSGQRTALVDEAGDEQRATLATRHPITDTWIDSQPFGPHPPAIARRAHIRSGRLLLRGVCEAFRSCRARLDVHAAGRLLTRKRVVVAAGETQRLHVPLRRPGARTLKRSRHAKLTLVSRRNGHVARAHMRVRLDRRAVAARAGGAGWRSRPANPFHRDAPNER